MIVEPIARAHAPATVALLRELRVSLFGVQSSRLHEALVSDSVDGAIDGRVAIDAGSGASGVHGVVLVAPASYWRNALVQHWGLAVDCLRARVGQPHEAPTTAAPAPVAAPSTSLVFDQGMPARRWSAPGDAWRTIFIGTTPAARGQGVAAALYRSVMAERSLVARIALDNTPSLRLHRSLGWRLYRDGDVVLAVHDLKLSRSEPPPRAA